MTRTAVVTNKEVLQTAGFRSEEEVGGSDAVTAAIEEAESEVSNNFMNPYRKATFVLENTITRYEFRIDARKVYRIDNVIIRRDDNTRRVYTAAETASESSQNYVKDLEFNTITFASGTVSQFNGNRVEVDYVPIEIHWLTRLKAAMFLLDSTSVVNGEVDFPVITRRIFDRINRIQDAAAIPEAIGSEDEKFYDPTIGEIIPQRRFRTF